MSRGQWEDWKHAQRVQLAIFIDLQRHLLEFQKNMLMRVFDASIAILPTPSGKN